MSKRTCVLILTLAAALLVPACAKKEPQRGPGSEQWRREAYNRYVILDMRARRLQYDLATIRRWQQAFDYELAKPLAGGTADTAEAMATALSLTGTQPTQADLDDACARLEALVQQINAEIALLRALLAGNPTNADLTVALARIVGMSDDLSEIEDEVISIREGGGMLVFPPDCQRALDSVRGLQATLSQLEAEVNTRLNPSGYP